MHSTSNWTPKEERFLRRFYRNTANNLLSRAMNRSRSSINHKALRLGLSKSSTVNSVKLQSYTGQKLNWISGRNILG